MCSHPWKTLPSAQPLWRGGDIFLNLFFQLFYRAESLFPTEPFDKLKFEFLSVEISLEAEQVHLHAHFRHRSFHRRAVSDVDDRLMRLSPTLRMARVDAYRRQHQPRNLQICCGKPEFASELFAGDDAASERIGAPEHLTCQFEVT